MSDIWLIMVIAGAITYLIRLSFIFLLDRWQPPDWFGRALRYVPPAVLSATFVPELLMPGSALDLSFGNARLLAGLVAIGVAWFSRSALLTIGIGMAVLILLQWVG